MKNLSLLLHVNSSKWPIDIESCLPLKDLSKIITKKALCFFSIDDIKNLEDLSFQANLVLVDNQYNQKLNKSFRQKNKETNVLSFPLYTFESPDTLNIGDIYIAKEIVAKEAQMQNKQEKDHLMHLITHGVLHLLGYDHETASDAEKMETLEINILKILGIQNPYLME